MKKLACTFIAILFCTITAFSQTQFQKSFGNASAYDEFFSVCRTTDGGYAFLGNTIDTTTYFADALLVKTDNDGNLLWSKSFSFSIDVFSTKIVCNSTGELFLMGYTFENNPPYDDIFLIKTAADGSLLWSNRYGGTDIDEGNDLAIDNNGDLIIAGYTYSFGTTLKSGYAIKLNDVGTILWSKAFSQNLNQEFNGVSVTSGNDYIFTGLTQRPPGINFDGYLIRTNSSGLVNWAMSSGGTGTETYYHSFTDASDTIYVSGGSSTGTASGNLDGLFVKYDLNGNRYLNKTYGTASVDRTYNIGSGPLLSNEIILSGHTSNASALEHNLFMHIDKYSGTMLSYELAGTTTGKSRAYGLLTEDQSAVQAGFSITTSDTLGSAFAAKYVYGYSACNTEAVNIVTASPTFTDSIGSNSSVAATTNIPMVFTENIIASVSDVFCLNSTINEMSNSIGFNISPNPVVDRLQISFDKNFSHDGAIISIFDLHGHTLKTVKVNNIQTDISIENLPAGIYLMKCEYNGVISSKRFIKSTMK